MIDCAAIVTRRRLAGCCRLGVCIERPKKHPDDDAFISELATWLISGQGNTLELSINV
jgi:hypothetical protein